MINFIIFNIFKFFGVCMHLMPFVCYENFKYGCKKCFVRFDL